MAISSRPGRQASLSDERTRRTGHVVRPSGRSEEWIPDLVRDDTKGVIFKLRIILENIQLNYTNVKVKKAIFIIASVLFVIVAATILFSPTTKKYKNGEIQSVGIPAQIDQISTAIVPHFDEFKTERQKMLADLAPKISAQKIVLVSVNHFGAGQKNILLTKKTWDFAKGSPKINENLAGSLLQDSNIGEDNNVFESEHGIKNVLPDLYENFTDAEFLPSIPCDGFTAVEWGGLLRK